jgi:hypothetical protein
VTVAVVPILGAGVIAGILSNVTGYALTGRLFHPYQARTPNTWRAAESWATYLYSAGVRIIACIGIALLYDALAQGTPIFGGGALLGGVAFGVCLWAVAAAPVIVETALFVNWHRGFLIGLLLDWLVVCLVAGVAAAVAVRAV